MSILAMLAPTAHASDQVDQIRSWLRDEWKLSQVEPDTLLEGKVLRWRKECDYTPPANELEDLRRMVEANPRHHDRGLLALYESRLSHGPTLDRMSFHVISADRWRSCRSPASNIPGFFIDAASDGTVEWLLLHRALTIMPAGQERRPNLQPASVERGHYIVATDMLLRGPLAMHPSAEIEAGTITADAEHWKSVITSKNSTHTLEGGFDASGRPFLRRSLMQHDDMRVSAQEVTYGPCRELPLKHFEHVQIVEQRTVVGDPRWKLVCEGIEPIDPEMRELITRTPTHGGSDPMRGVIQIAHHRDFTTAGDVNTRPSSKREESEADPLKRSALQTTFGIVFTVLLIGGAITWKGRGAK